MSAETPDEEEELPEIDLSEANIYFNPDDTDTIHIIDARENITVPPNYIPVIHCYHQSKVDDSGRLVAKEINDNRGQGKGEELEEAIKSVLIQNLDSCIIAVLNPVIAGFEYDVLVITRFVNFLVEGKDHNNGSSVTHQDVFRTFAGSMTMNAQPVIVSESGLSDRGETAAEQYGVSVFDLNGLQSVSHFSALMRDVTDDPIVGSEHADNLAELLLTDNLDVDSDKWTVGFERDDI